MCRRVRAVFGVLTVVPLILSNMVFLTGTTLVIFVIKKIFFYGKWNCHSFILNRRLVKVKVKVKVEVKVKVKVSLFNVGSSVNS